MPSALSVPLSADRHPTLELLSLMSSVLKERRLRLPPSTQNECKLIASMVESGHLAHGRLTEAFGKGIDEDAIHDFVMYLMKNYFNHVTCSGQIKRNFQYADRGEWLCLEKLRKEFSVFNLVLDSLLELPYVNEENIGISATLTIENGSGTEHTDRQNFAIRLIFTFLLAFGTGGAKDFLFRHPVYHGDSEESHDAMVVRTHEFVAIDATSSGRELFEDKLVYHQALANSTKILTPVLSIFQNATGPKVPPLPQFIAEWRQTGAFKSLESNYLRRT
ncbi:predicted protein [Chaetoceros tenuissimus]|uniref:Uncharacterized protein n=1 Tax=Chaetoceros tenuissimus TaxID=426638 RepID=A0AAD3D5V7_9STRA|nr:predicted protein [Chaetoceros tenuissimus]